MLHWHGDTFDLPAGAVHLAATPICPNQAFHIRNRAFGLQFHCELRADTIAAWVRDDADYVLGANGPGGGERILADTQRFMPEAAQVGDRLLRNIFATFDSRPADVRLQRTAAAACNSRVGENSRHSHVRESDLHARSHPDALLGQPGGEPRARATRRSARRRRAARR